jgi:hypothetical protein
MAKIAHKYSMVEYCATNDEMALRDVQAADASDCVPSTARR